jgi:hypothetical protein
MNMASLFLNAHLHRHGAIAMLAILTMLLCIAAPAQAQFDQQAKNDARLKNLTLTRRSEVLASVLHARAELSTYDKLMAVKPEASRDSGLIFSLNKLRYSILEQANSAYFFAGPTNLPAEDERVYAALCADNLDMFHMAWPPALSDLVKFGYLPHLPESPYATGEWLTAAPTADPPPGSVLYMAWAPQHLVFNTKPALECFVLAVFNDKESGTRVLSKDDAASQFIGDVSKTLPYFPTNMIYFGGQDYDS